MLRDTERVHAAKAKARIFISYSRKDMTFVDRLEAGLKARGFEPLIDRTEIYAFEDWWKRIEALIARADTVVFALSPDAVASDVALKEIAHAASLNKRFAPIVVRRVDDVATPEPLRRLNFIFFDEPDRFEASTDQLAEALQTDISWIRQHTEFGEAALRWSASGRPGGLLLRSPVLEQSERWIASRPRGAPEPTAETRAFIAESRRGTTRRRNVLTGSLAAGLVAALALAGLAYWQRGIAVEQQRLANEQRQLADQQRKRAEDTLTAATETANRLVFDLAGRFRNSAGIPAALIKDILDRARTLQTQLAKSGQMTPDLRHSEAAALSETVGALLTIGNTKDALAAAEQARQIFADLNTGNPSNTTYQRDLAVSHLWIGNVQFDQGNLTGALQSYRDYFAIMQRLAKSDLTNAGWQRDLSMGYAKVGDVQVEQGDVVGAMQSYRDYLAVMQRLAKADPANTDLERGVSVAYEKVADVQVSQGDLSSALQNYRDSLTIAERLAQSNPGNAELQRDLSGSYDAVGFVQRKQRDFAGALKSYRDSFAIRERLAQSDPGNAGWQRDLSVSNEKIGNVQFDQGDLTGALQSYRGAVTIMKRLTQSDPSNAGWQRNLSVFFNKVANTLVSQGDVASALESYRDSLTIVERLAKTSPGNAQWQRDLAATYGNLGLAYHQSNDSENALTALRQGEAIIERLTNLSPDNAAWKRDLAWFKDQIAALTK